MKITRKGEFAIDRFLQELIRKYLFEICVCVLLALAVVIRVILAPQTEISPDYDMYFKAWTDFFKEHGIRYGLEFSPQGADYFAPLMYMYMAASLFKSEPWLPLALFSAIFEFANAFLIWKIAYELSGKRKTSVLCGVMTLFLPYVVMDGALWKQVDAIYTTFLLASLLCLLRNAYRKAMIWFAIAFSIKLQAVLALPLYLLIYIARADALCGSDDKLSRRLDEAKIDGKNVDGPTSVFVAGRERMQGLFAGSFSVLEFLWIPFVFLIVGIPQVLCQHGLRATYFVYFIQAGEMDTEGYGMTAFMPNVYNFGYDNYDAILNGSALLGLLALFIGMALLVYKYRSAFAGPYWRDRLVTMMIVVIYTCCVLMPGMHERYDYTALILITVYALLRDRRYLVPAVVFNMASLVTYGIAMFHFDKATIVPMSVLFIGAYVYLGYLWIMDLKKTSEV